MTASVEAARVGVFLLFAVLTWKSLRNSRRGKGRAAAWLAASFAVLAVVTLVGVVTPGLAGRQGSAPWKLTVCVLLLFPYLLDRFTATFATVPSSRRRHALSAGLTVVLILSTLALPVLTGTPRRTAPYRLYALVFMAEWTLLSVLSAWSLWRAGRGQPTVVCRRMRTLSLGSFMVNAALILIGTAPPARPPVQLVVQLLGMASGWLFFVGFAPPAALRAFWRQPELDLFHAAEGRLVAALDAEAVARVIVPQAVALLGGAASFMTDREGRLLAAHGVEPEAVARVVAGLDRLRESDRPGAQELIPGHLALPLRGGWLVVAASPVTPSFGREELGLFEALGHSAELALERADLFERDREGRHVLEKRERQQAAVARLGQRALGGLGMEALLDEAADLVARALDVEPASVLEVLSEAGSAAVAGAPGDGAAFRLLDVEALAQRAPGPTDVDFLRSVSNVLAAAIQRHGAERELAHQALHDPLTGLPNRALLRDRLDQAASRAWRRPEPLTVLFLDLDRFKVVNDGLGHGAGDELLRLVARRLVEAVRPSDTVARFGGDEFVVVCEAAGEEEAVALAQRIADILASPVAIAGREVAVTASIGIVVADATLSSPEELLRDADTAMYQAKDRGRGRYEVFDAPARQRVLDRLDTEVALHRALGRGEFRLWYQPVVSLEDGRILGLEALLRWEHPEWGLQLPGQFLQLAEETGLILPIGEWALNEACRQAQAVRSAGPESSSLVVWVNLSARQLLQADLVDVIARVLRDTATDPALLGLEITETVLMEEVGNLGETLRRLRRLGVRLAIDDFGTGFSSLSWLRQFPVDVLKVDRSFVNGVTGMDGDRAIVEAVVGLAGSLQMIAVAEGVESRDQVAALRSLGCDAAQGFYFCPPMDHAALLGALSRHGGRLPWSGDAGAAATSPLATSARQA